MKIISFFIPFVFIINALGQNTITTSNLTQTSFCAGGNIVVEYTSTGTFPFGCTFSAELSDGSGNFTNPVVVGSMPIDVGIITGTIPSNTPFGFNYRVRVVASDPYTIGSVSTNPIIITSTAITATIIARPSTEICHGDTISLWVTFNESYHWSTGQTSQTIHVTESGIYTVSVKNYLTGCEVTSDPINITVHPTPVVNFGPDQERCDGQHITLNAGSGFSTYLWNDSSSAHSKIIDTTGTYSVIVVDSFGCKGGDTIRFLFRRNPVVNLGSDTNLCKNSLLLSAGAGFSSYNWNNGLSFNPVFLAETSGRYFVSVTDSHGCSDSDTILVNIHSLPVVNLGNDLSACGTTVLLDAGSGFSAYNWNNGLYSNRFFPVNATGIYFVKVTDQHGCINSDTIRVTMHPMPDIHLEPNIQLPCNDSLILDAGPGFLSYQWSTGQTSESIGLYGGDYPLGHFTITVSAIDSNGCINSDEAIITIVPARGANGFSLFPNPFHDEIQITSSKSLSGVKPVFCDMPGRYFYPEFTESNSSMLIKRGNIAEGYYVLFFEDKEGLQLIGKCIIY